MCVDFPEQSKWTGLIAEMEFVPGMHPRHRLGLTTCICAYMYMYVYCMCPFMQKGGLVKMILNFFNGTEQN